MISKLLRLGIMLILIFPLFQKIVIAQSETGMLRGVVKDESTGEGLPFVTVKILGTKLGTNSNSNGLFVIKGIPYGKYKIQISAIGYNRKEEEFDFSKIENKVYLFKLKAAPVQMSAVVKEAERIRAEYYTNISVQNITAEELKIIPLPVEKDIFRSLKAVPGISTSSDVSGQFFARGGSGDQNLILYDNMVIYNPFHALGIFSIFDGNAVKSYELQTGGFDPEYNGRLSSVLNITTKDGNRNYYNAGLNLNMLSLHGFMSGPTPYGTASLYFRKSVFDEILKKYAGQDVPLSFFDVSGKVTVDFTESGKISLNVFRSGDNIKNGIVSNPEYKWSNSAYSFTFQSFITQFLFTASCSYSSYNINMDYGLPIYGSDAESKLYNFRTSIKAEYLYENNDITSAGMNLFNMESRYKATNDYDLPIDYGKEDAERSFWLRHRFTEIPNTVIEAGLNQTFSASGNKTRNVLEPRVNFKLKLNDDVFIKGSFTRMHQAIISIQDENDLMPIFEAWIPISEMFHPERADQFVLGVDSRIDENYSLIVQGYIKKITNYIGYNLERKNISDPDFLPGTGESKGIETYVKFKYDNIYGWITYNLNWTDKIINNYKYAPRYDKRHSFCAVLGIKLPYNVDMGFIWEYSSGMPFTSITGIYHQPTVSLSSDPAKYDEDDTHVFFGDKNASRLPDYHKLDINFSRSFIFEKLPKIDVGLDVTNVYNKKNIFYFNKHNGNRVNMLPFFITLSLGIEI